MQSAASVTLANPIGSKAFSIDAGFGSTLLPEHRATSDKRDISWYLFSFQGRATRLHYFIGLVAQFAATQLVSYALEELKASTTSGIAEMLLTTIFLELILFSILVAILWINLTITVRRWHDRDKSGYWALLGLIPIIGWLWQGIECGLLDGTLGPNRFGPSPKGITRVVYGDLDGLVP
jgi:uncharacterized membrane protein YhaH (DUF805 family)